MLRIEYWWYETIVVSEMRPVFVGEALVSRRKMVSVGGDETGKRPSNKLDGRIG